MKRSYHTVTKVGQTNARRLTEFLSRNGQVLLPMVDLIEQSRLAVDELIDVAGRATIETVLQLSAEQVAGPRTPGRRREEVGWHGRQRGWVCLKERELGVSKPRLRAKGGSEVPIPAYEAMQDARLGRRMLDVLQRRPNRLAHRYDDAVRAVRGRERVPSIVEGWSVASRFG